ncbi:hypothetical protein [Natrarchaeobaculum sulfurireducens]|uniref:Uncharacterized protein n=1 Tax=Natrarchaeobaculum sulfurireducens TaxID=2044521 RepID=A0A346PD83_9EURY|nr:hypothetical protein [Natrarchaeobaculum sulfurireducens]AXR77478.1 hypothetical protein AArc1_1137 [Natrarchaeobaculum sulfurireducens]
MSRDSEEKPREPIDGDQETGASEPRTGQSSISGEESGEGSPSDLKDIQVKLVDEVLEAEKQQVHVDRQIKPETDISPTGVTGLETLSKDNIDISKIRHSVDQRIAPQKDITATCNQLTIPVTKGLEAYTVSHTDIKTVSPNQKLEEEEEFQLATLQELLSDKIEHSVNHHMIPAQQQSQSREPMELDKEDPVFTWGGGSPYSSGRPKLVLHRSTENLDTLPFLQVLLRDTYKEIEGGEPGAETVEFVANEPRIPQVQKNIVTLDLTNGEWKSNMRGETPVIERNDVDIVSTLREVSSTLYTGELGYFVVNIPDEWEGDLLQGDFFDRLVKRVAEAGLPEEEESEGFFEVLQSSPVVIADPKVEDKSELIESVARYFSINSSPDRFVSVDQVEQVRERALKRNDWKRIALTERQSSGKESDEHYFWKAAITEGLAWEMQQYFETQERPNQDDQSFEGFVRDEILENRIIETEKDMGDSDEETGIEPDIFIKSFYQNWVEDGTKKFLDLDEDITQDVAIEFETGRSEGAFNFRKVRETLEKYPDAEASRKMICLVLPTRLFFRGEKRAQMILDLVSSWDKEDPGQNLSAEVFVPVLEDGYCRGLESADEVVDRLYRGEER